MKSRDWRELLGTDDGLKFQQPATEAACRAAESALGTYFPEDLRNLYRASDGVFDGPGEWFVIWPLAVVVERNLTDWTLAEAPGRLALVGFGDDGAGAPFCLPRDGAGGVRVVSDGRHGGTSGGYGHWLLHALADELASCVLMR